MVRSCIIIAVCACTGCGIGDGANPRLEFLESRVVAQQAEIERLTANYERLNLDLFDKLDTEDPAIVDVGSKTFSISRNRFGAFPVIVDDVMPFADGHKLKMRLGNLSSGTITGFTADITYGMRYPRVPKLDEIEPVVERKKAFQKYLDESKVAEKSRRKFTVDQDGELKPAEWTPIEVFLAPSTPQELAHLEVQIQARGVSLLAGK